MNNISGKLIHLLPQRTNEGIEVSFIPEDTDFIQDHSIFEDRRQQLISEYERELRIYKDNTMQMI
jgi:hypothetical protein